MILLLGVLLGGISELAGGVTDTVIQRLIEVLRSPPTIPLWMGLGAAMPKEWEIVERYFAITVHRQEGSRNGSLALLPGGWRPDSCVNSDDDHRPLTTDS